MSLPTTPVECSVEVGYTELEFFRQQFRIEVRGEFVDMFFLAKNVQTLFQTSDANYI
jgi:hypothetical protein